MEQSEKIKFGLTCLGMPVLRPLPCSDCPYHGKGLPPCRIAVCEEAVQYIEQLKNDNDRLHNDQKGKDMATNDSRQIKARRIVMNYFNSRCEKTDDFKLTMDDVFVVWFSKTLQNWKALVSTTVSDGMYYEVTHNGDMCETYLDAYKKWENVRITDEEYLKEVMECS